MGRRPNQLVNEFFQRGQKLPDASNRYAHTCKRCGELFPKGRLDSMMGHLLRRCPNVTQQDREAVFLYMQSNPSRPAPPDLSGRQNDMAMNSLAVSSQPPPLPHDPIVDMQMQSELPFPLYQEPQSALGMLAEVSRRHLDYSSQRGQYVEGHEQSLNDEGRTFAEQALLLELQQASRSSPHPSTTITESPGMHLYQTEVPQPEHNFDFHPLPATTISTFGLVDTSTQTDPLPEPAQQVEAELHHEKVPAIDPQLRMTVPPTTTPFEAPVNQASIDTEFMMWNPTTPAGRETFGTLNAPSNEPTPGFGILNNHAKKPARGRFTETRRKEVQDIRKRGACIRCRMLKKPCSEGTPCVTCANVETARLWKGTCIRTRLADEFTLWSIGLFHSTARIEVPAAVQGLHQLALPGRMEARVVGNSDLCMSFAVKQYSTVIEAKPMLDPSLHQEGNDATCIWLLDEGENMCDKIEEYVNRVAQARVSDESCPFLKATLQQALNLLQEEKTTLASLASEPQSSRSGYSLHTQLLKSTVELWTETCILVSGDNLGLSLHYDTDKAPQHLPESVSWPIDTQDTRIAPTSPSFRLIRSQLLAAMESRSAKLAKTVINELERRLLQRQQVSRFSTFISAVVLLSSVERITAFYRAFDDHNGTFAPAFAFTTWPLAENPHKLWPQGEHFADLLVMLLRMRALPPKTLRRSDGALMAVQDYTLPVHVQGRPVKEQIDEQVKAAAAWLDPIKLDVGELAAKVGGPVPGVGDGVGAWDLRFLSKVLLPEATRG
ncbi:hypothetical protein LTR08_005936 [Meristemomyces frigidus]|nr:hypothetical protein LTR08_005936 [Meristemomyces frigidus]